MDLLETLFTDRKLGLPEGVTFKSETDVTFKSETEEMLAALQAVLDQHTK